MRNPVLKHITVFIIAFCISVSFTTAAYAENNDGVELVKVPGETFTAYMLIVDDPSRVILGCRPDRIGNKGYVLEDFVNYYDAVAGINAGGFDDPNGNGNGSTPDSVIVHEGEIICGYFGIGRGGFVGIDGDGILQVDFSSVGELSERNIREGAGFGPVLIRNGEITSEALDTSSLNPRTAIGQRSDGAILMLVIDGRQVNSLGGSFKDEADIMLSFGAVTACNLDGGSSSLMYYGGDYLNNVSRAIGVRQMPSSFLVLKEGRPGYDRNEFFPQKDYSPYVVPGLSELKDDCNGDERDEVISFAEEYLKKYVAFSADVGHCCIMNYGAIAPFVVHGSQLQERLHSAFGSFGYTITKKYSISEFKINSCSTNGDSGYIVDFTYSTLTTGRHEPAEETRNMRLGIVRDNGKLYVDSMTFYI